RVTLGYEGSQREVAVYANARTTIVRDAAKMPKPLFILPNGAGLGYGLFVLDEQSATYLLSNIHRVPDALTRGAGWVTLWDNVLEGHVAAGRFIDSAMQALPAETDEQNTQRILGYLNNAYWRLLSQEDRMARAPAIEAALRAGIARAGSSSLKSAWFSTFRDVTLTPDG